MDIETRFESLEKKLRLHKRIGLFAAALILCAASLAATGATPEVFKAKTIEAKAIVAESFFVKDSDGKVVSFWGAKGKEGEVYFALLGEKKKKLGLTMSKKRAGMLITGPEGRPWFSAGALKTDRRKETSPAVTFFDRQGRGRAAMGLFGKRSAPGIVLVDSNGQDRVSINTGEVPGMEKGFPALELIDSSGQTRASLAVLEDEKDGQSKTSLIIFDSTGKKRIAIGVDEGVSDQKGTPLIEFFDSSEKFRAGLGISHDKMPGLVMADGREKMRAALSLTGAGEPRIRFKNEKGKLTWVAPPDAK
jgi:hypothetical protein